MDQLRRLDMGAVLIGLIILGVGTYYLLVNTFGIVLPELDGDQVWPLAVIALGVGILWRAWSRMSPGGHRSQDVSSSDSRAGTTSSAETTGRPTG